MPLGGGSIGNYHHAPAYGIGSLFPMIRNNENLANIDPTRVAPKAFNEQGEDGNTPLHLAIMTSSLLGLRVFSCLARHPHILYPGDVKKAVNKQNREGNTPIHLLFAMRGFHEGFAIQLLKFGDCSIQNAKGETPLHLLLQGKDYNVNFVMRIFNRSKVNVNQQNNQGNTYLHLAAQQGDKELAHLLLAKGAVNRILNNKGLSPLDVARECNQHEFITLWAPLVKPLPYHQPGFSALLPLAIVMSRNPRRNTQEKPTLTGLPHKVLWNLMEYLVGALVDKNDKADDAVNFSELPDVALWRIADYVAGYSQGHIIFRAMIECFNNRVLNAEESISASDAPLETQKEKEAGLVFRSFFKKPSIKQEEDEPCCSSSHETPAEQEIPEDRKGKRPAKGP